MVYHRRSPVTSFGSWEFLLSRLQGRRHEWPPCQALRRLGLSPLAEGCLGRDPCKAPRNELWCSSDVVPVHRINPIPLIHTDQQGLTQVCITSSGFDLKQ
nr:unnamed protein product [Callosobruchus analis]